MGKKKLFDQVKDDIEKYEKHRRGLRYIWRPSLFNKKKRIVKEIKRTWAVASINFAESVMKYEYAKSIQALIRGKGAGRQSLLLKSLKQTADEHGIDYAQDSQHSSNGYNRLYR